MRESVDLDEELLRDINRDLIPGIDWKGGARNYVSGILRDAGPEARSYLFTKPFAVLGGAADDISHQTFKDLMRNFLNAFSLLALPAGSRVLDVACGSGWISQFLSRLGYHTFGIDISAEMIEAARERLGTDPFVGKTPEQVHAMFAAHDIEDSPVPHAGQFDAAILESCLHHFFNPIAALRHIRQMVSPGGLILIIEGENRTGPLKPEYVEVMRKYATIERPYSREQLVAVLSAAGLPFHEFFAPVNGWYSPYAPETASLHLHVDLNSRASNKCVCAAEAAALQRILPWWHPDKTLGFAEGITPGSGSKLWCAPYARMVVRRRLSSLTLRIGTVIPAASGKPQSVSLYSAGSRQNLQFQPGESPVADVDLTDLSPGTELQLCSDAVFSPAWSGGDDPRSLSFWFEPIAAT